MPFRKLGGKCHFFLRFCTRKRSKTYKFVQKLIKCTGKFNQSTQEFSFSCRKGAKTIQCTLSEPDMDEAILCFVTHSKIIQTTIGAYSKSVSLSNIQQGTF